MICKEEEWVALSQLKRSDFYIRTMLAFGVDHVFFFQKFVYKNRVACLVSF